MTIHPHDPSAVGVDWFGVKRSNLLCHCRGVVSASTPNLHHTHQHIYPRLHIHMAQSSRSKTKGHQKSTPLVRVSARRERRFGMLTKQCSSQRTQGRIIFRLPSDGLGASILSPRASSRLVNAEYLSEQKNKVTS